jgi:H+/Cl- antiporter ClcA
MIFTFVILMPLGLVLLRVVESVRWHAINQTLAAILAIIGGAIGIYLGLMYNRVCITRKFQYEFDADHLIAQELQYCA